MSRARPDPTIYLHVYMLIPQEVSVYTLWCLTYYIPLRGWRHKDKSNRASTVSFYNDLLQTPKEFLQDSSSCTSSGATMGGRALQTAQWWGWILFSTNTDLYSCFAEPRLRKWSTEPHFDPKGLVIIPFVPCLNCSKMHVNTLKMDWNDLTSPKCPFLLIFFLPLVLFAFFGASGQIWYVGALDVGCLA